MKPYITLVACAVKVNSGNFYDFDQHIPLRSKYSVAMGYDIMSAIKSKGISTITTEISLYPKKLVGLKEGHIILFLIDNPHYIKETKNEIIA